MKQVALLIALAAGGMVYAATPQAGDVIINEIGNQGTKKGTYTGKDYVELLVLNPSGVSLAGCYLTDLSSPSSKGKDNEGAIRLSDGDSSVFKNTLPRGTYVLVCFGAPGDTIGTGPMIEQAALGGESHRIVVFTEGGSRHIEKKQGTFMLNGKDNLVLLSDWKKDAAVDIVIWNGGCTWQGCTPLELDSSMVANGCIAYFAPNGKAASAFAGHSNIVNWVSATDPGSATPGRKNPGVDDSELQKP